jgi:hypothetical protein
MVHRVGFEPTTTSLEGRYSIQLSYRCIINAGEPHPSYPVVAILCIMKPKIKAFETRQPGLLSLYIQQY